MKPFAIKLKDGSNLLGLGLSTEEIERLQLHSTAGVDLGSAIVDLGSIGVGLWFTESDGSRSFIQPRDSKILLIAGDSKEAIGNFLKLTLP
jgi:hypothetical protein